MFKLVHYEACRVGKRAVVILLESILLTEACKCKQNLSGSARNDDTLLNITFPVKISRYMQGLFAVCIRVGSGDPVRVLHLLHNEYTGYN